MVRGLGDLHANGAVPGFRTPRDIRNSVGSAAGRRLRLVVYSGRGRSVAGEMTLRLPVASGTRLAQKFLQETERPSAEPSAQHKEALEELLRQIAGQAATALASAAGGEVQFHVTVSAAPSWSSSASTCLYTRDEAGTPVTIEIQISAALAAALQPRAEAQLASASGPAPPAAPVRRCQL
jgi:chemotaxis protein CheY-P-specific phosphatase CheC